MIFTLIDKYKKMPRILRATFWFLICSFLQKGISVLTTPIFTRLLNPIEYGQFSVFNSWYQIIEVFVSLEIAKGVYSQGLVKFSKDRYILSSSFQGLNCVLALVWTGIYLLFHEYWNSLLNLNTTQMLCMLIMIWATSSYELWATEQRTVYNYRAFVILTLITSLLKPLVGVFLVINADDKVTARIFGLALVEVIAYSGLCLYQIKRGKKFFSKKNWVYALSFNIPLVPHYLSQIVMACSDRIMIKELISESAAGIYYLGYSVALLLSMVYTALEKTISPWIYKKLKANETNQLQKMAILLMIITGIATLVLVTLTPEIISIFAPATYSDAVWTVPPVALSNYCVFLYMFFACIEFYYEEKRLSLASIVGAILNIVLNYLLIPKYGYIAAAYTTLICSILYVAAHYYFMRIVCKKYLNGKKIYNMASILLLFAIVTISSLMLTLLYSVPIARYALLIVGVVVFALFKGKWIPKLTELIAIMRDETC